MRTYHDIESPKLFNSSTNKSLNIALLPYICFHHQSSGIGVLARDDLFGLLNRGEIDIRQYDMGAFRCEKDGRFQSDAPVRNILESPLSNRD